MEFGANRSSAISPSSSSPGRLGGAAAVDGHESSMLAKAISDQRVSDEAFSVLVTLYTLLILFGTMGNLMVIGALIQNPGMRTARNYFILNLAISDILLCTFTMPFTFIEIVRKFWNFGDFMCKFIGSMEAMSIFLSTMNITAIAVDRYHAIVANAKMSIHSSGSWTTITATWIIAILLSLPLGLNRVTVQETVHIRGHGHLQLIFCVEKWSIPGGRAYYSLFSMIFQYVIPVLIVSISYVRICCKLQKRLSNHVRTNSLRRKRKEDERVRRINVLLILISVIFGVCWMPLNLFNLLLDCCYAPYFNRHVEKRNLIFALCHLLGMSSACLNPVLYGWLNDNFRKEFKKMLRLQHLFSRWVKTSTDDGKTTRSQRTGTAYTRSVASRTQTAGSSRKIPQASPTAQPQLELLEAAAAIPDADSQRCLRFLETDL